MSAVQTKSNVLPCIFFPSKQIYVINESQPNSLFILTKFNNYRAVVIFGLNALSGRTIGLDGLAAGAWNSSDAESLIRYSANKGYTIHGWELGKGSYIFIFT